MNTYLNWLIGVVISSAVTFHALEKIPILNILSLIVTLIINSEGRLINSVEISFGWICGYFLIFGLYKFIARSFNIPIGMFSRVKAFSVFSLITLVNYRIDVCIEHTQFHSGTLIFFLLCLGIYQLTFAMCRPMIIVEENRFWNNHKTLLCSRKEIPVCKSCGSLTFQGKLGDENRRSNSANDNNDIGRKRKQSNTEVDNFEYYVHAPEYGKEEKNAIIIYDCLYWCLISLLIVFFFSSWIASYSIVVENLSLQLLIFSLSLLFTCGVNYILVKQFTKNHISCR